MVDNGWFGGNTLSELMGTYLERVVGDDVFEFYGLQFPVMVKVMDVTGWQPLQMNASDEIAAERYELVREDRALSTDPRPDLILS